MSGRSITASFFCASPGGLGFRRLMGLWLIFVGPLLATVAPVPEFDAKARYLEAFVRYVEWPANGRAESVLVVGVLGHDPFGGALETAFSRSVANGRRVVVRRVASSAEARGCDLVFISREEARRQAVWLAELSDAPVLTVSDHESALNDGAAILLVREDTAGGGRLRFDVNLAAVERAGLKVGSDMMKSARRVIRSVPKAN